MVLNDLVDSCCYSLKYAGLKGLTGKTLESSVYILPVKLCNTAGTHESDDGVSDTRSSILNNLGRHVIAETRSADKRRRMTKVADDNADTDA